MLVECFQRGAGNVVMLVFVDAHLKMIITGSGGSSSLVGLFMQGKSLLATASCP